MRNKLHICFTLPVWTKDGVLIEPPVRNPKKVNYMVYSLETGKDGYMHYQGYMELISVMTKKEMQKMLGGPAHLTQRRKSKEQAINYCKKDCDKNNTEPYEDGKVIDQGERTDIQEFYKKAEDGEDIKKLARENPALYSRVHNALDKFLALPDMDIPDPYRDIKRQKQPECIVIFGPPSAGKLFTAEKLIGKDPCYRRNPLSKSNERYKGEGTIWIEEFGIGNIPATEFLMMVDRGRYIMDVKYKSAECWATRFIITTNDDPKDWYPGVSEHIKNGVRRRITRVIHLTKSHVVLGKLPDYEVDPYLEDKSEVPPERSVTLEVLPPPLKVAGLESLMKLEEKDIGYI